MKKAVLFVRVSTEKQTLESQIEALKRTAFIDGYSDSDLIVIAKKESGVKLKESEREGLNELKSVIIENDVDCVYIFELSRLSRDPMTLYSVRDKIFKDNKVQLKCLKPTFSLLEEPERTKFDAMGSLVFSIFGCFAEQEVVEKKERFHRGKAQKAIEGKYSGGTVPYGYEIDANKDNLLVINHDEADIIHTIFDLYEAGYSLSRISQELRERGLKYQNYVNKKRSPEKDFGIWFVHQILTAELLTGRKTKGATASFARSYPAIISEAQFNRCRKIAEDNNTSFGKVERIFLAKGLIRCPECGANFRAYSSKIHYSCPNALMSSNVRRLNNLEDRRLCSNNICISISAMDALLWHVAVMKECEFMLGSAISDKSEFEHQIAILKEKIDAIQPRLDDIAGKRSRIVDAFIEGEITKETELKKFAELDEQKQAILRQKVEYEQKVEYFQSRIADIMNFYSMESLEAGDLADSMENALRIREKIEATATDEEKSRLVHKHIKEVNVEKQTIVYTFNEKKVKEAPAKYVTITFYDGTQQYFHFISTDGKGGHWIDSDIDGNVLGDLPINIERKITNQTKLRIRAKEKERKKAAFESIYSPDRLYLYGCREMAEYLCLSKNSIQRFCKEGFFKDALSKYGKKTYILDAERALEIMRASEEAWIKKAVQNFDELHGKEETK
jgi:site-specific DNA recombinase